MFRHYLRLCAIFSMLATAVACHAGNAPAFPSPSADASLAAGKGEQTAVVAGGCFWGVQAVFQHVKGVISATSGYAGGEAGTAHYDRVSDGNTGHAESVKIIYDPSQITYGQLLRVFFYVAHDPTELNRQGPDEGTQYRSVIFYASDEQKQIAEAYVAQLNAAKVYRQAIVTQVVPLKAFYAAEEHHQNYARRHPNDPYISFNDAPKLDDLKDLVPELYTKNWAGAQPAAGTQAAKK